MLESATGRNSPSLDWQGHAASQRASPGSGANRNRVRSDPEAVSPRSGLYARFGKRAFDLLFTLAILPLILPVILAMVIVVARAGGRPIYSHTRIGKGGRPFGCLKIRTMVVDADKRLAELLRSDPEAAIQWGRDQKLQNDPRVTRIGALLRKTSLDELPQIFNVLRGEMSIVGPRPLTAGELDGWGADRAIYEAVRPGLTGLWQIESRRNSDRKHRIAQDARYVAEMSFLGDLRFILRTIPEVVFARGC